MLKVFVFLIGLLGSHAAVARAEGCAEALTWPTKLSAAIQPYLDEGFYVMEFQKMDYTGSYQVTLYHPLPQGKYIERASDGRGMTLRKIFRMGK